MMSCTYYRKKLLFLVQNTWTEFPLFEASEAYLAHYLKPRRQNSDGGCLVFLRWALDEVARSLPVVDWGLLLEAEVDDAGHTEEMERS